MSGKAPLPQFDLIARFRQHSRRFIGLIVVAGVIAVPIVAIKVISGGSHHPVASAPAGAPPTPDFLAYQSSSPYIPLFTTESNCGTANALDSMDASDRAAKVAQIAGWYDRINAQSSTSFPLGTSCEGTATQSVASLLAAAGVQVSNYRNGSFVSQSNLGQLDFTEASSLETTTPASIETFWPGDDVDNQSGNDASTVSRLVSNLDASSTTITVTASGSGAPAGASNIWPYEDSRGTGLTPQAHSTDTHNFVSWISVDDELMQVVGQPTVAGGNVTLSVVRGLWGTTATTHTSTTRVMSPVYSGSSSVVPSDSSYNGAPFRNDANYPLRYVLKVWEPAAASWIAGRIQATFGGQGYNAVWSDVSGCDQYSFAAGDGSPVAGWNDSANTALTDTVWGGYQVTKVNLLRADVPGYQFSANSALSEGNNLACEEGLLSSYDSASLENWMDSNNAQTSNPFNFSQQMMESFAVQANNWPAIYWARWDLDADPVIAAQYERFAYAAVLLAESPSASRYSFGDAFGFAAPDPLMFWDWGTPASSTATLADVTIAGTPLFGRQFANGEILINPTTSPYTYTLPVAGYDVVNQTGGNPTPVTTVTVGADDAAFILQPTVAPENLSVADTSVARAATGTSDAVFTVSLPQAAPTAVTASYSTFGDTAVSNTDFTPTSGTVTIPAGATSATISVPVIGNQIYQPTAQTFWLTLTNPTGASLERATAQAVITNPAPQPALSVSNLTVNRSTKGTSAANFTITASNPSTSSMQVSYATSNGSAKSGVDYTTKTGTAFLSVGSTTSKLSVPVASDPNADGPVAFTLTLSSPSGATVSQPTATATLNDPAVSLGIKAATGSASGTSAPPINFPITLNGPADAPITISYATQDGSAKAGTQYQAATGTFTIPAHTTTINLPITLLENAIPGPNTSFTLAISNPTGPAGTTINQASAQGTIDNTTPDPTLSVAGTSIVRPQYGSTRAMTVVTMSNPSASSVSFRYATTNGSATAGVDYTSTSGTGWISSGQTTTNVSVPVLNSGTGNKQFNLVISVPTNSTIGHSTASISITTS